MCGIFILRKYLVFFYSFQLHGLSSLVPLCSDSWANGLGPLFRQAAELLAFPILGCLGHPSLGLPLSLGRSISHVIGPWFKVLTHLSSPVSPVTTATC